MAKKKAVSKGNKGAAPKGSRKRSALSVLRKLCLWTLAVVLVLAGAVLYCNIRITTYSSPYIYDDVGDVPHRHAALLLGTSPKMPGGNRNKYFVYRIEACAELYRSGKVDRIIVSGDHRHKSYNEPEAMRRALIEKGVPAKVIFLDHAGLRTLDSVVRAREVFGQQSYIIVSQRFHNERGVFIARKKGIDAIAYDARDARLKYGYKTRAREILARCKVFLDLFGGVKPRHLGEPVDIG